MDYILQMEKLLKFLEFNLELGAMRNIIKLKRDFNNDLNLLGCFVKDLLTVENFGTISSDDEIYNDFVLCFEKYNNQNKIDEFLDKINRYYKIYLQMIFEETSDKVFLNAVCTVNSCYYLEFYPFLMELKDDYNSEKFDNKTFALVLQLFTDIVIKQFENPNLPEIGFLDLKEKANRIISTTFERVAV